LSCDRETYPTSVEVPLSQRAGEVEAPLLRRSGSVTSTVSDEIVGHASEALGARPKTPSRAPRVSSSEGEVEPEPVRVVANKKCRLSRKVVTLSLSHLLKRTIGQTLPRT